MSATRGLRPLELPAIMDEASRLLSRRPSLFLSISVTGTAPCLLATYTFVSHCLWSPSNQQSFSAGLLWLSLVLTGCLALRFLSHGALSYAALELLDGRPVSVSQAWRAALPRGGTLAFCGFISLLCASAGLMVLVIPGLWLLSLFSLAPALMFMEDRSYFGALRALTEQKSSHIGRAIRLQLLCLLVSSAALLCLASLASSLSWLLQSFLGSHMLALSAHVTFANPFFVAAIGFIALAVTEPLRLIAQARLVLDHKVRKEGYDLLKRASRVVGFDLKIGALVLLLPLLTAQPGEAQGALSIDELDARLRRAQQQIASSVESLPPEGDLPGHEFATLARRFEGLSVKIGDETIALSNPFDEVSGDRAWRRAGSEPAEYPSSVTRAELSALRSKLSLLASECKLLGREPGASPGAPEIATILEEDRFQRRTQRRQTERNIARVFEDNTEAAGSTILRMLRHLSRAAGRFWSWLESLYSRVFSSIFPSWSGANAAPTNATSPGFRYFLALVAFAGFCGALWYYLIRRGRASGLAGPKLSASLAPRSPSALTAYSSTEASWRGDAQRAAGATRYNDAVRASYAGLLLTLNKVGLIEYDRTSTNWEYLRDVRRAAPELADHVKPLTETFDATCYGLKSCDAMRYEEYRVALDELLKQVEEGEAPE